MIRKPDHLLADLVATDELTLVRRAVSGDPEAIEQLAPWFAKVPAILGAVRATIPFPLSEQDRADLIQDCLELVWRKLPEFEGRASLTTWMFRVCSLELRNGLRRIAKHRRIALSGERADLDAASGRDDPAARSMAFDLEDCLARLEPDSREIVRARHYDERTFEEIAGSLGLKTSQAKTMYYRALLRIRDWLAARDEELAAVRGETG